MMDKYDSRVFLLPKSDDISLPYVCFSRIHEGKNRRNEKVNVNKKKMIKGSKLY